MQININTDHTIDRHQGLDEHVATTVRNALDRFGEHITSVEVHLSNAVAEKSVDGDNRCMLEAHVAGYKPVAVQDHGVNLHQAISGATDKLKRALDSALGKLNDKRQQVAAKHLSADL
ncbi:MAG: HPF/RaiA family ribosome-associated protein [Telluria sp.]